MTILESFIGNGGITGESPQGTSPIMLLPEIARGVRSCSSPRLPMEPLTRPYCETSYAEELQAFIDRAQGSLEDVEFSVKQTTKCNNLSTIRPVHILSLVTSMSQQLREAIERNSATSRANFEIQLENETLQQSLQEQIQVAHEVRTDVLRCLHETRTLSQQSLAIYSQQVELEHNIEELQWEAQDWKNRCRRVEHPCMPCTHNATNDVVYTGLLDVNGAVKDIHVTYFQMSIDQIIEGIRAGVPQRVTEAMRRVVISVGQIKGGLTDDTRQRLGNVIRRVSLAMNSLLIESEDVDKNEGLRSLSPLEAKASKLIAAVIALLRMAKIKPTPQDELTAGNGYMSLSIVVDPPPPPYAIEASIQSRHTMVQETRHHQDAASSVYSDN